MERGGVKIRAVRPDEGFDFGIDAHLVEYRQIPQWAEELSGEDRLKIDYLLRGIIELDAQNVGAFNLERLDSVQGMVHGRNSPIKRIDGQRRDGHLLPTFQERCQLRQFRLVLATRCRLI